MKTTCEDTHYRCQYEDREGRLCCTYVGVIEDRPDLCPVCGDTAYPLTGHTADGRRIGQCGDAFHPPSVEH